MLETIFLSVSVWPDPSELCYIIPFWHLLSNFNEMTQANKLSLNFPSLCPLVSSFINWTANVVLILSFLQLNLEWPSLLVVYGPEWLSLTFPSAAWHPFCFSFFPVEMNEQDIRYRDTLGHGNGGTVYKWVVLLFKLSVCFAKCWEPGTSWQGFTCPPLLGFYFHIWHQDLQGNFYFLGNCLKRHLYCLFNISESASLLGEWLRVHH